MFCYVGTIDTSAELMLRDQSTFAVIDDATAGMSADEFSRATDGEIHHYCLVLAAGGQSCKVFFDGELWYTIALTGSNAFASRFTNFAMGADTFNGTLWVGHAAIHERALTDAEVLDHANAATAATESDAERVVRVAGRIGVPSAEIDVETSVALPLGPQPEAGRAAAEILDELAVSTSGVLYDTRTGHLALQARNHRYNSSAAFTLNATTQEVAADLTATLDDRYLTNYVEMTRSTADAESASSIVSDSASIDKYGYYSKSFQIVSSSENEVDAAAADQLARYAAPKVRISQVSVDLVNVADAQRIALLAADIGTMFNISNLPAQAPTDPMSLFVEGYTETISATTHTLTINTTPGTATPGWVLGDASLSNLGSTTYLVY
jgi:hypothetical protein